MKKYVIFCCLCVGLFGVYFWFFSSSYSNENTCNYQSQIDQCLSTSQPRSITDFVCIKSDNKEDVVYQIILDEKFKEVDENVMIYLDHLEKNKSYYFGQDKQESHLEWIDQIIRTFGKWGEFWWQLMDVCKVDGIISEAASCLWGETANINVKDYFSAKETICTQMAETKLNMAREVAFDILNLNKHAVRNDEHKKYVQEERTKYDELLQNMMINQGYMTKILQKTPSLTKNTY